jgi:hypothetical protein
MSENNNNTITIIVIIAACVLGLSTGHRIAENAFENEAIKHGAAYRDAESGKLIWTNEGGKP